MLHTCQESYRNNNHSHFHCVCVCFSFMLAEWLPSSCKIWLVVMRLTSCVFLETRVMKNRRFFESDLSKYGWVWPPVTCILLDYDSEETQERGILFSMREKIAFLR